MAPQNVLKTIATVFVVVGGKGGGEINWRISTPADHAPPRQYMGINLTFLILYGILTVRIRFRRTFLKKMHLLLLFYSLF